MKRLRKVLIIKTGFSEFLDRGISTTVSLGDVLICTSLLHNYKSDQVTWVTDWQARALLKDNPYIYQLLIFGTKTLESLLSQEFDILINLEKDIGICTFLNKLKARKKYGFYFNDTIHNIATRRKTTQYLLAGQENHKDINKNALEILYETVGEVWDGQGLILGHKPNRREHYDVGFNYAVGSKWPTKAWAMDHWKSLEKLLSKNYKISWQQGHKNLSKYIDWINDCRLIITSDSLGQALAQALGKKVVTLYGPTNYVRMQGIPEVTVIPSTLNCPHMPCFLPVCKFDKFCMDYISPEKVAHVCREKLK